MANLAGNRNTSVHGTGTFLRGRVLKHSHRIRELATRDLLDKLIVAHTTGGVSDRTRPTIGLAKINSIFVHY